jgi:hypothetical protein
MKAKEEILQNLNMLQKQAKKNFGTKPKSSARQVTTSKSHRIRDEHGNDRQTMSRSRHHQSLEKYTRRAHASSGLESIPSVSPIKR